MFSTVLFVFRQRRQLGKSLSWCPRRRAFRMVKSSDVSFLNYIWGNCYIIALRISLASLGNLKSFTHGMTLKASPLGNLKNFTRSMTLKASPLGNRAVWAKRIPPDGCQRVVALWKSAPMLHTLLLGHPSRVRFMQFPLRGYSLRSHAPVTKRRHLRRLYHPDLVDFQYQIHLKNSLTYFYNFEHPTI